MKDQNGGPLSGRVRDVVATSASDADCRHRGDPKKYDDIPNLLNFFRYV